MRWLLWYYLAISVLAAALAGYDKFAAKAMPRHRVRESVLLLAGALGGAAAEFVLMKLIHHKTRKKKFMISLPLMALLHAALAVVLVWYGGLTW